MEHSKGGASHSVPITPDEVQRFCEFLYRRTGMSFTEGKRYFIDRRLEDRIAATGSLSFQAYFSLLRADADHEIEHLINSFTVNETYFYREDHQLRCMTASLLDSIVSHKKPGGTVRIWSIPCSTGEEPYSIALWLMENWAQVDSFQRRDRRFGYRYTRAQDGRRRRLRRPRADAAIAPHDQPLFYSGCGGPSSDRRGTQEFHRIHTCQSDRSQRYGAVSRF